MGDLDLLTEIHTKVIYIADTLEKHINHDEKIEQEYLRPLWEAHQQAKGAAKLGAVIYTVIGGLIIGVMDYVTRSNR